MNIIGVIPARLKSERFPNKLLEKIEGKKIIQRVIQNAMKMNFDKLMLVTDSMKLVDAVIIMDAVNIEVYYQKEEVNYGSERVKYAYNKFPDYDYYVTIPADEPYIDSTEVNFHIDNLKIQSAKNNIFTFYSKFYNLDRLKSTLSCKIVTSENDDVLYFSRAIIPITKSGAITDLNIYKKHVGIFIFPKTILDNNIWKASKLANIEGLEQNMFLENGYKVKALKIDHEFYGIDTKQQIKELEASRDSN